MPQTFTVLIPYYNEEQFLERTLASWRAQTRPPERIVAVDNGSTDRSRQVCRSALAGWDGPEVIHLTENRPGKIQALQAGCAHLAGTFVVLADADTWYPPHYLALCEKLADDHPEGAVSLMALSAADADTVRSRLRRRAVVMLARLFRRQGFVGGYGQVLRREALQRAGGFSTRYWSYVLLDHEILNRLFRYGYAVHHVDLWCRPSRRRGNRCRVRWNLFERTLYHLVPYRLHDWYFYDFLAPRLASRGLDQLKLREQPWQRQPVLEGREV